MGQLESTGSQLPPLAPMDTPVLQNPPRAGVQTHPARGPQWQHYSLIFPVRKMPLDISQCLHQKLGLLGLTPNNGVIVQLGFAEHQLKISPIRYGPFSGQLNMACLEQTDHTIDIYVNRC